MYRIMGFDTGNSRYNIAFLSLFFISLVLILSEISNVFGILMSVVSVLIVGFCFFFYKDDIDYRKKSFIYLLFWGMLYLVVTISPLVLGVIFR